MKTDLHVHTLFSSDSAALMQDCCERALQKGLTHLCFTEHFEHNPNDPGTGYYRRSAYFDCLHALQRRYGGKLRILAGLEFAEPHLYPQPDGFLKDYDMILGSIHWVGDQAPYLPSWHERPQEAMFEAYWREMEQAVEAGGFHVLSHLDFPKRYAKQCFYQPDTLLRILQKAVQKGILIEINASTYRQGFDEPMPSEALLSLYQQAGGRYVTIGADAHRAVDVGSHVNRAAALAKRRGLRPCYLEKGKIREGEWYE